MVLMKPTPVEMPAEPATSLSRLLSGFCTGCRVSLDGFIFMCRHPSLWSYGILPVFLNIVLTMVIWLGAFRLGSWLVESMTVGLGNGWWDRTQWWLWFVGTMLLTLAVAFVAYIILMSVFCSVFFSMLARKVELQLGAAEDDFTEVSLTAGVLDALRASLKLIVLNLSLLLLNIVPGVGTLAATVLGLYVDALIVGAEFLSFPLELRGMRWKERQAFSRTWRGETLGIGIVVTGLMLIPVAGAVFMTTSVVGAVLLCRRLSGLPVEPPGREETGAETDSTEGESAPV